MKNVKSTKTVTISTRWFMWAVKFFNIDPIYGVSVSDRMYQRFFAVKDINKIPNKKGRP